MLIKTLGLILLFCCLPAGVVALCRRIPLLGKLGPIMVLYALGMLIGNLPFLPEEMTEVQEILPNVLIPLAIPMMLFGCTFSRQEVGLQAKIILSGFLSVAVAVAVGYLLFGQHLDEGAAVGGILTGMYTGGTLNAAALQAIFHLPGETFVLINSYDILISFLYFVFLFGVGIRLFRWCYGEKRGEGETFAVEPNTPAENPYRRLLTRSGLRQLVRLLGVTLLIVLLSAGVALLFEEGWFMVIFILLLTTLGVACSFIRRVRELDLGYDVGMYLIYIFSLTIASMADFSNLDLVGGVQLIAYMSVAVFLSLLLHASVCRLLRVDADSMMISSVAFINSPPFVPMAAAAMQSRKALVTGLAAGIAGYAAGNHLGVLMRELLNLL